uniref:Uncharacterized protein n=1 Tax=Arundo donax TaxID=35708 RepID=A0A0A8Z9G5_ARUDO
MDLKKQKLPIQTLHTH